MNRIIFNPFTGIARSTRSHTRGYCIVWSELIGAKISEPYENIQKYDEIYIDHGVNFSGTLNLFGGFTDLVYERCENLIKAFHSGSKIFSLDWDLCHGSNYIDSIRKRIGNNTTSKFVTEKWLQSLKHVFDNIKCVEMIDFKHDGVIFGDSHSIAYAPKNFAVMKTNGLTLNHVLDEGLLYYLDCYESKNLQVCLGSIDIRFHAIRTKKYSAETFADMYTDQVLECEEILEKNISVCAPVPIEHEGRRIPQSGQYKGNNFYGSRDERLDYTLEFIMRLEDNGIKLNSPPESWYSMESERYAKDIMEISSSVHIAPSHYNSIIDWKNYE